MAKENSFGLLSKYRNDEFELIYYNYDHYTPLIIRI